MNVPMFFILVFVVGVAVIRAQCPPVIGNDGSITATPNGAGTRIRFRCIDGDDRIVGTNNRRATRIDCLAGNLVDPRPCCEKKKCDTLPPGTNTEAVPPNVEMVIGDTYTYQCLPGYSSLDLASLTLTCESSAGDPVYNPSTAPTCMKDVCGLPPDGTNTVSIDPLLNLEFMDGFSYQCITGYTTNDPTAAVCLDDGELSIPPPNCNIRLALCTPNPCLNGGACTECVGGYSCQCASGFMGDNCENRTPDCSLPAITCQNGGTCVITCGIGVCNCAPGWTGGICATNINECAPNPCRNGGTCTDGLNIFTCTCPPGWTGSLCQDRLCPAGWRLSPLGFCYYFSSLADRRDWDSARSACPMATKLVILQNAAKLADLSATAVAVGSGVAPNVDYWIGGGQLNTVAVLDSSALFRWIDTTLVDGSVIATPGSVITSSETEMLFYRFRVNLPDQIFYDHFVRTKPYICEQ